jgi:cytolysin-activating lysine-acyltransferase
MKTKAPLTYLTPGLYPKAYDRMAVFGAISALWMASPLHSQWPIAMLGINVMPALKTNQFLLACVGNEPIAYVSWAYFDDAAEARYLANTNSISETDWTCGSHIWFIDWIAPFGRTHQVASFLEHLYFPKGIARALRVRKDNGGQARVLEFAGIKVSKEMAHANACEFEERLALNDNFERRY